MAVPLGAMARMRSFRIDTHVRLKQALSICPSIALSAYVNALILSGVGTCVGR